MATAASRLRGRAFVRLLVVLELGLFAGWSCTGAAGIHAAPLEYDFEVIAHLGGSAPGGDRFTDFQPSSINSGGEISFISGLTAGGEGVFVSEGGELRVLARIGWPAPGGGTFGPAYWGNVALADNGDVAFAGTLDPFSVPLGLNSGVYRYDAATRTLGAVVIPDVTPAPGGSLFAGAFFYTSFGPEGRLPGLGRCERLRVHRRGGPDLRPQLPLPSRKRPSQPKRGLRQRPDG